MRVRTGVVVAAVVLAGAALVGCSRERERRIEAVKQDEEVLRKATTVVNQVTRAAGDCDAVKAALPEARQRVNEAASQVKEEGSRRVLMTFKEQLDRATEACP